MRIKFLRILFFILTLLVMSAIFSFSHQTGQHSSSLSTGITEKILAALYKGYDLLEQQEKQQLLLKFSYIIRITAHFGIFLLLGLCAAAFIKTFNIADIKVFITSCAFCLFYAFTDELHQYFVQGRSFEFFDIAIDFSGSVCGIAVVIIIYKFIKKRRKVH